MIISPVSSVPAYDPISQVKSTANKNEAASSSGGAQAPAQAARSAPHAVVKPVADNTSLTSDKIYDRRDANQDGSVSYQESLKAKSEESSSEQGSAAQPAAGSAYNQMGKAAKQTSGVPQSSFNLFA